jgi:hypothetical protein
MWRTIAGLQDQTVKPAGKRNPTLRDGLQISSGNGRLEVNGFCELCQGFICSLAPTTLVETLSCRSKISCSSPSNFCAPVAASLSWPVILTGGPVSRSGEKNTVLRSAAVLMRQAGCTRAACSAGYAALELVQIAGALPREITKSRQRPAGRIAAAALDDRRPWCSLGMSNLDRQASAGLAHQLEFMIVERIHRASS